MMDWQTRSLQRQKDGEGKRGNLENKEKGDEEKEKSEGEEPPAGMWGPGTI